MKRISLPVNRRRGRAEAAPASDAPKVQRGRAGRWLMAGFRVAILILTAGATVAAGLAAWRHATTSDYFSVNKCVITGLSRLSEGEIRRIAGLSEKANIFRFDLAKAKERLEADPWIAEASLKRRLPRTVEIRVLEHRAVAMAVLEVPYLINDEGAVFKRWVRGDPVPSPILSGFARDQFIGDPEATQQKIRDAIDLARRYRSTGLEKSAPLAEVHQESDGSLSLVLGGDSVYVRFGRGPYRDKLTRLAELLGRLRREQQRPALIYFDNDTRPGRVNVKLRAADRQSAEAGGGAGDESILKKSVSKI